LHRAEALPVQFWFPPLLALGLGALFAQAMVYADTRRKFWRLGATGPRFLGSALVMAAALALAFQPSTALAVGLIALTFLKLAVDLSILKHADSDPEQWTQLRHTAALQWGCCAPRWASGCFWA
jgi:hypothetical protein